MGGTSFAQCVCVVFVVIWIATKKPFFLVAPTWIWRIFLVSSSSSAPCGFDDWLILYYPWNLCNSMMIPEHPQSIGRGNQRPSVSLLFQTSLEPIGGCVNLEPFLYSRLQNMVWTMISSSFRDLSRKKHWARKDQQPRNFGFGEETPHAFLLLLLLWLQ